MSISSNEFDPQLVRPHFPALRQEVNGKPAVYLDGPGGTQAPVGVIKEIGRVLSLGISNRGGPFLASARTDEIVRKARAAIADLYHARRPEEIVFGQNMTSLTFSASRAISRGWRPGDEIIVTRLDHDANISPWLLAAEDKGVTVRWLDFHPEDCTLDLEALPDLLSEKTRLVAVTYASNAVGSISDVKRVVGLAHQAGALTYVDSVHYAPHGLIDVQALDCDFLVSSAYKYFGTHTGVFYGKYDLLDELRAYKVRPASNTPPGKWETGTQSFESLAGVTAAVEYLAGIGGQEGGRRERLVKAFERIKAYEMGLSEQFLRRAAGVPGLHVYGITDIEQLDRRTPTFAVSLDGYSPQAAATALGEKGVFVWHGDYYAVAVMERLGLLDAGGLVRIGFVHYNTLAELDRTMTTLEEMAGRRS